MVLYADRCQVEREPSFFFLPEKQRRSLVPP